MGVLLPVPKGGERDLYWNPNVGTRAIAVQGQTLKPNPETCNLRQVPRVARPGAAPLEMTCRELAARLSYLSCL